MRSSITKEVVILCGEWETGPTPQNFSDEKYNVVLQVEDIIRHPDFEAEVGVEGGNDIAVFKVNNAGLKDCSAKDINPICLPEPSRPAIDRACSDIVADIANNCLPGVAWLTFIFFPK